MGVATPPSTRFQLEQAVATTEEASTRTRGASKEHVQPIVLPTTKPAAAIVVVDPFSTGAVLSKRLHSRGVPLICVWSDVCTDELMEGHVREGMRVPFAGVVHHTRATTLETTIEAIRSFGPIRDVIVGCETGVLLTDRLAEALGFRGNGTAKSAERRNKWLQNEAVRAAGLPACGQKLAESREDVELFLCGEFPTPFKAVVKPVEGAGSDGVFICDSADEVREAFGALEGTKNALGLDNYQVLLQEYLAGDEYVVDTVSRDGVHKCVALWVYDKRKFNGAPVVYYGMRLVHDIVTNELAQSIIEYTLNVLYVLGIENGAVHSEVKATPRGPVLVEANCRMHGGDGQWVPVPERCLGYSQVSALADAYLDPAAFAELPARPAPIGRGAEIDVRSTVEGVVTEIDQVGFERIRALPSYVSEAIDVKVGSHIQLTKDALTIAGGIQLASTEAEQMEADYALCQEIIDRGLFVVA